MVHLTDERSLLPAPDREEVLAVTRRFFDAGMCCAVETELNRSAPGFCGRWESRLLLFRSAHPGEALKAVEHAIADAPGVRVRLVGYFPAGRRAPSRRRGS